MDPRGLRWVTLIVGEQAQPGRRIRPGPHASHVWTVKERVMSGGRQHIVFTEGGAIPVARARKQRWQVEVWV